MCQDSVPRAVPTSPVLLPQHIHTQLECGSRYEACRPTNVQIPQEETFARLRAHLLFFHLGSARRESLAASHWFYLALIL